MVQPVKATHSYVLGAVILIVLVCFCVGGIWIYSQVGQKPAQTTAIDLRSQIEDMLGPCNRNITRITFYNINGTRLEIQFAANDNAITDMIHYGAKSDIVDILRSVKNYADPSIQEVSITVTFALVDLYGNAKERQVIATKYQRSVIDKVNFDNFLIENVYEIAEYADVHNAFKSLK